MAAGIAVLLGIGHTKQASEAMLAQYAELLRDARRERQAAIEESERKKRATEDED